MKNGTGPGLAALLCVYALSGCTTAHVPELHQTTGIKICEVSSDSAIVWTRLCAAAERVNSPEVLPVVTYLKEKNGAKLSWPFHEAQVAFPQGESVMTLDGAVPGASGEVQVWYKPERSDEWRRSDWIPVAPEADYTAQVRLRSLEPGTTYALQVHSRQSDGATEGQMVEGTFRTAPDRDAARPVSFVVTTGQRYPNMDVPGRGFKSYDSMLALDPDFFVHTGDILYYDQFAKSVPLAHWHWQRTYSLPTNVRFHKKVASYFIKDDHDTLINDCWRDCNWNNRMGSLTFDDGIRIFKEQVGMGDSTHRTIRWGKDLQIWLVEGRDFRSSNKMEDGPAKTIWGAEQLNWFRDTVKASDATFRILISPTPVVGPDRKNKGDNHANKSFEHEGRIIRNFLGTQKNMHIVCGDRHWQYVSRLDSGVMEYSCGPLSDKHAGGWRGKRREMQLYLAVRGGFLRGLVERRDNKPVLVMQHYSPEGELLFEDIREAR